MSLPTSTAGYPSYQPRHSDISDNHPPYSGHGLLHHPYVDSRHYEQEALVPMHEHHHPPQYQPQQPLPHPPTHPHYAFYSSKDSLIQPEYPEDNRCPTSASLDGSHCSASQFFATSPVDYDSIPQLPAMPLYSQYTGPSSMQPSQPYESQDQSAYASSGDDGMVMSRSVAKKRSRASQACESCRQLKAKCDESKPCRICADKGLDCIYSDPPPKVDAQKQILEDITSVNSLLSDLTKLSEDLDARLARVESDVILRMKSRPSLAPRPPDGGPAIPTNHATPFVAYCWRVTPNEKA